MVGPDIFQSYSVNIFNQKVSLWKLLRYQSSFGFISYGRNTSA